MSRRLTLVLLLLLAPTLAAQQVDPTPGSLVEQVRALRSGEYIWVPQVAPKGPTLLLVNVTTQRATLYRNGVPIGATTVSTGRPGYDTPTGVFTILEKRTKHFSAKYDNAPMPYMQRLTWYGIALHAGHLPGRPASHGCIRLLPLGFAERLYGATKIGMTVIITDADASPRLMPTSPIGGVLPAQNVGFDWQPNRSPAGPVSIIVSAADRRAIVLRNGIQIGSGPVEVVGAIQGTWAYASRSDSDSKPQWFRVELSSGRHADQVVPREEWQWFRAPEEFRRAIAGVVRAGTTIIVTADSLDRGVSETALTILESGSPSE